jgi:16S rRNA (uracil1498-N3)-methyltransferase
MKNLILSNIELYYSSSFNLKSQIIKIEGEESNHILIVMRHKINDEIYVTNGLGKIFKCRISQVNKKIVEAKILDEFKYEERFPNTTFCIPMLRNNDRLEFALEKCTELGITNFIIYYAERSVGKKLNQKRIEKILASAMKQSLLSWLPKVKYYNSLGEIASEQGERIIFDQNSTQYFDREVLRSDENYFLVFGPEGGLTNQEVSCLSDSQKFNLADNRLRSETAIIKAASLL